MANLFDKAVEDIKSNRNPGAWIILLIIVAFIILVPIVFVSNRFFRFFGRLFYVGYDGPSWILWGILGLLVGAIYGAWSATRRYNLEKKWVWIPAGGLIFYIMVLFFIQS